VLLENKNAVIYGGIEEATMLGRAASSTTSAEWPPSPPRITPGP
jgi:hypothetical protein